VPWKGAASLDILLSNVTTSHQRGDQKNKAGQLEPSCRAQMKDQELEVKGSGNVFRDLGHENADAEQLKAILAAEIIKTLDREKLTVRQAHDLTGIAAADFSRIRNAALRHFSVERLMSIINRFGSRIEVNPKFRHDKAA
jgi:predicted XRE-type DNA-binding protein